jgi:hypothetical protein
MGNTTPRPLPDSLLSADEFPTMLTREEKSSETPYYDSQEIPTIGIGVNLTVPSNLTIVLEDLNAVTGLASFQAVLATDHFTNAALQKALNTELKHYPGASSSFELTQAEVTALFNTVVTNTYQPQLNAILSGNDTPIPSYLSPHVIVLPDPS